MRERGCGGGVRGNDVKRGKVNEKEPRTFC